MKDQWKFTKKGIKEQIEIYLKKHNLEPYEPGPSGFSLTTAAVHLENLAGIPHRLNTFPKQRIVLALLEITERLNKKLPIRYHKAIRELGSDCQYSSERATEFYASDDWAKLRYQTLLRYGKKCMACGDTFGVMCADHIKPLRKYWHLRLDPENTQVLCKACNLGKGNRDETDWRPKVSD